jgi:hypothetical protein
VLVTTIETRASGAANHRGSSEQSVKTPPDLMAAVQRCFGRIAWDLAAEPHNAQAERWLGPGGLHDDSFTVDWHQLAPGELLWLNCEFANIRPWAAKCAAECALGARILLLVPASVDSNWYANHVHGRAAVYALNPRVKFVGHKHVFPKPLALCLYGDAPGFDVWRWKL